MIIIRSQIAINAEKFYMQKTEEIKKNGIFDIRSDKIVQPDDMT